MFAGALWPAVRRPTSHVAAEVGPKIAEKPQAERVMEAALKRARR